MKRFEFIFALLLTFSVMGSVYSQELTPELESMAKKIEIELIAPCCMLQQVSIHSSPVAREIKADIRKMLAAGKTRQEILDHYVEKYGTEILASPPKTGFNLISYWMPVVFVLLGFIVVAAIVKVWIGRLPKHLSTPPAAGAVDHDIDEETSKQIEHELEDMD